MVNSNLRGDDGQDLSSSAPSVTRMAWSGWKAETTSSSCSNGSVGADTDLLVAGQNRDFNFVFLAFRFHDFVVLRERSKDGVGVAFLGVGDAEFQRRREDITSSDDWTANGRLQPKVVVSIDRDDQRSRHSCAPPFGRSTRFFHSNPCEKIPSTWVSSGELTVRKRTNRRRPDPVVDLPNRGLREAPFRPEAHQFCREMALFFTKAAQSFDSSFQRLHRRRFCAPTTNLAYSFRCNLAEVGHHTMKTKNTPTAGSLVR